MIIPERDNVQRKDFAHYTSLPASKNFSDQTCATLTLNKAYMHSREILYSHFIYVTPVACSWYRYIQHTRQNGMSKRLKRPARAARREARPAASDWPSERKISMIFSVVKFCNCGILNHVEGSSGYLFMPVHNVFMCQKLLGIGRIGSSASVDGRLHIAR